MSAPGPQAEQADVRASATRSPLWMRVLLSVSLAANLLIVGLVLGLAIGGRVSDRAAVPRDVTSTFYMRALPDQDRAALARGIRTEISQVRTVRRVVLSEVAQTLALLRSEDFTAEAFAERIDAQRALISGRAMVGDRMLVERVAAMTHEERVAYADRLEEIGRRNLRELRTGRD